MTRKWKLFLLEEEQMTEPMKTNNTTTTEHMAAQVLEQIAQEKEDMNKLKW
jgi:hypothetical protein